MYMQNGSSYSLDAYCVHTLLHNLFAHFRGKYVRCWSVWVASHTSTILTHLAWNEVRGQQALPNTVQQYSSHLDDITGGLSQGSQDTVLVR